MKSVTLLKLLCSVIVIAPCAGCCCWPKNGITLRGGLDFREIKKPSGFVELVDTGWDERRRLNDLKWLENADCLDDYQLPAAPTAGEVNEVVPPQSNELPSLGEPSELNLTPVPPEDLPPAPAPPNKLPPVPAPEPEPLPAREPKQALEKEGESVSLPSTYDDQDDYQKMIELTNYEKPARSVANRPSTIQQRIRDHVRRRTPGRGLWAKP